MPIAAEATTGMRTGNNGATWHYGYDISCTGGQVVVRMAIQLIAASGVSKVQLDTAATRWEAAIAGAWSNRFAIATPDGEAYPIVIEVSFTADRPQHRVIVSASGKKTDALNWNIQDPPVAMVHEFGHLLGVYDEYRLGATAPEKEVIEPNSVMTSGVSTGTPQPRHYQEILAWFAERTGMREASIKQVDSL